MQKACSSFCTDYTRFINTIAFKTMHTTWDRIHMEERAKDNELLSKCIWKTAQSAQVRLHQGPWKKKKRKKNNNNQEMIVKVRENIFFFYIYIDWYIFIHIIIPYKDNYSHIFSLVKVQYRVFYYNKIGSILRVKYMLKSQCTVNSL